MMDTLGNILMYAIGFTAGAAVVLVAIFVCILLLKAIVCLIRGEL
jgi:hypothetical protein